MAGVALGGICRKAGAGRIGPACHLCTPLPGTRDILGTFGFLLCEAPWRRHLSLFLPALL